MKVGDLAQLDELQGQRLQRVSQQGSVVGKLIFDFETARLVVSAVEDDDTISIEVRSDSAPIVGAIDVSEAEPWARLLGEELGWGWLAINLQGYPDTILLSFDGIVPQIVLNVMASSIRIGTIHESPAIVRKND